MLGPDSNDKSQVSFTVGSWEFPLSSQVAYIRDEYNCDIIQEWMKKIINKRGLNSYMCDEEPTQMT